MNKIIVAIVLIALLLPAIAEKAKEVKADPYPMPGVMVRIINPQNTTYTENRATFQIHAMEVYFRSIMNFSYSLDDSEVMAIKNITVISENMTLLYADVVYCKIMEGNITLGNLSEGWHKITVYCQANEQVIDQTLFGTYSDEDTNYFKVSIPKTPTSVLASDNLSGTILYPTGIVVMVAVTIILVTLIFLKKQR